MNDLAYEAWSRLSRSLSTNGLQALSRALVNDDERLVQGTCGKDCEPYTGLFHHGDPLSFALATGDGIEDWDTLSSAWSQHMVQSDGGWGPGQIKSWALLAMWDEQPREKARMWLLELVEVELQRRAALPMVVSLC